MTETQDWYHYEQSEMEKQLEEEYWENEEDERQVEFISDEYQERETSGRTNA